MRIRAVAILLFLAWLTPVWAEQTSMVAKPITEKSLRVLFIGNSYTAINDLPQLTSQLAASARPPRTLETAFVGEGGATLKRHWEAGRALETIREGRWDYVILQDQGTLGPSEDFRRINDPEMFHTYARLFDAEIRKAGAKTLFFLTWARQDSPQSQALLTNAYVTIAVELKALVAPVGIAWQNALKENPEIVLHDADRSHPAPAGSYLAACVLYAVLFSNSPEGISQGNLGEAEAATLQRIAWQTARDPQRALAVTKADSTIIPEDRRAAKGAETATPESLERGRLILAAAQKGVGGLDRLQALKDISVTFTGRIHSPMGEMVLEGRETAVFPNVLHSDTKLPFGNVVSFYDGSQGWRKTPQGVQGLEDRMKKVLRAQVIRNTFNLLRADGEFSVQFEKRESVGETTADVILITKEEESVRLFIGAANGMLMKKTFRGMGTGGPADIEEIYSDFREVSGMRIPFRIESTQNGAPFLEVTINEVKLNTGVNPADLSTRPQ